MGVLERRRETLGGGHGEGARPLPPRIFAGHKRGTATILIRENCPAGPPRSADFFEPVLVKSLLSLRLFMYLLCVIRSLLCVLGTSDTGPLIQSFQILNPEVNPKRLA
jgi:hypothetical protein